MYGAGDWNRTNDLRFTKPLLYQLSYAGAGSLQRLKVGRAHDSQEITGVSIAVFVRYLRRESGMPADFEAADMAGIQVGRWTC